MQPNLFRYIWRFSRSEQIAILLLIVLSLPLYWASLDIPKRIVNEAIQGRAFAGGKATATLFDFSIALPELFGGGELRISDGFAFEQLGYLFALSGAFLALVLINGWFKYVINIRKGVLGERMLRRLRYDLFAALLRFRPEDIRAVKPAEAAGMIKDEVEPIGGFIGEAFVTPAFLGTQALTAVIFILTQSAWLGMIAVGIVLLQAFVIPSLRREQVRLGRERQLASRQLAGRIGEIVDAAPALHAHGTGDFSRSEISSRLGEIFFIRLALYNRKFAVKYLNNLLAQITPFFFYAVGGYFALKGELDIGQLVAVIAAYRDLPPPIKELIDWDQQRADVVVKYEQVIAEFSPARLLPRAEATPVAPPPAHAPIRIDSLRVADGRGSVLLEPVSIEVRRPAHIALVGAAGSGRDIFAKVIGRQISEFQGSVCFGDTPISNLASETAGRFMAYAGADANLSSGTIRDNVLSSLRRMPPEPVSAETPGDIDRIEALKSGNPTTRFGGDWTDYAAAGVSSPAEIDDAILAALRSVGVHEDIYRLGLTGRLDRMAHPDLAAKFVDARELIRRRLAEDGITQLVEPFDPAHFNPYASIRENLFFGVPAGDQLAAAKLASDPFTRSILAAEALLHPLILIGLRIAEQMVEMFAGLPPGHALYARYSFIRPTEMDEFREIVDILKSAAGYHQLPSQSRERLVALAFSYIEPRHRLNLIDDHLRQRILRARQSFHRFLPGQYASAIEFYEPGKFLFASPISDNLLFGRIGYGIANAEQKVFGVMRAVIRALDLERVIYRLGLDYEAGISGKLLQAPLRTGVDLARCLIKRPDTLILDNALGAFGRVEAAAMLARVREAMAGRTLIATLSERSDAAGFDTVLSFDGARFSGAEDAPKTAGQALAAAQ